MRRRVGLGAAVLLAIAITVFVTSTGSSHPVSTPVVGTPVPEPSTQSPAAPTSPVQVAAPAPAPTMRPSFRDRAQDVVRSCGLPAQTTCDASGCVALVVGPDLDAPEGWAQMMVDSPRFVMSTALRDLGVPTRSLPCGQAVDALIPDGEVRAVELPDGTEVWCAPDGAWSSAVAASCNAAAERAVSSAAAGFHHQDVRRLEFRR